MKHAIPYHAVNHAGIRKFHHPRLGCEVNGQTAVRYLRFGRRARVDRLELGRTVYGRWVPKVPCHPAHLVIATLNRRAQKWRKVCEADLNPDPRIWGEGLSQDMPVETMEAFFERTLNANPWVIDLGGVDTDILRVECDREHPVWPNHGECNGGEFNVPFGILQELRAYGPEPEAASTIAPYHPPLKVTALRPSAPRGMKIVRTPHMLLFKGKRLSIGFSLIRPVLLHLGWDGCGLTEAGHNRLYGMCGRHPRDINVIGGRSGPLMRRLDVDCGCHLWTGTVSVRGNRVRYGNLQCIPGVQIDATFTVEPGRILIELTQTCGTSQPVLEAEAWRLAWNMGAGITGAAAVPTLEPGRNGEVELPMLWASDGVGALSLRRLDGDPETARFQVESYQQWGVVSGGFVLAARPRADACLVLPKGRRKAAFELAVTRIEPKLRSGAPKPSPGLRRHWGTVFSCFRPEFGGFSNHATSTNCHVSQGPPISVAAYTRKPRHGPDPLRLARYTITRALLDGGGYGYWRNLYLDSDPMLVAAAGQIHQARPDKEWLSHIEPGLRESLERMLGTLGKRGLVVCRDLSGNTGSHRWSSNGADVIGFGHWDAYVNAWTYRALRNGAALTGDLGRDRMAHRCREAAGALREAFGAVLVNPATGWVAGWRSRDGELHDYAFMWVNGAAIAFGLLDTASSRKALRGLEDLRRKVAPQSAEVGLPLNLLPIAPEDQMLTRIVSSTQPTFETYTDGSLAPYSAFYYIRALSRYGFRDVARRLSRQLSQGYAAGVFSGGTGSGKEFRSWEGFPTGYEGTLIGNFAPPYVLAIEEGVIEPMQPEWWPEGG